MKDDYGYGVKGWRGVGWLSLEDAYLRYEKFSEWLARGSIIFDVGCGNGLFYEYLITVRPDLNIDYYGIEMRKAFLDEFIRRFPEIEFRVIWGDFFKEPLKSTFDVVVAIGLTPDFDEKNKYRDLKKFLDKATQLAEKMIIFDCLEEPFIEMLSADNKKEEKDDEGGIPPTRFNPVKVFEYFLLFYADDWILTFEKPVVSDDFLVIMVKK